MSTEARVTALEHAMTELAAASARTQTVVARTSESVERLSEEMRAFKDEMRASKKDTDARWGDLSNSMGMLVENIVAPSIPELFERLFGVHDPDWYVRIRKRHRADPSRRVEFDVVAWGGSDFLATEVRSHARPEELPALVSRFSEVRDFFPEAEGRRVIGALATFYVDPSLARAAEREGLYVFGLGGGLKEPLNTANFQPRAF